MKAKLLDGKALAEQLNNELKIEIQTAQAQTQDFIPPGLAVIQVGHHSASSLYVQHKRRACASVGIVSFAYDLPDQTQEADLIALIKQLNEHPRVHGILVQLPLPEPISAAQIIKTIAPHKDVDGFHPYNLGCLAQQQPMLRPCTPYGIIRLLKNSGISLTGLNSVVVGASNIVGRPMALELLLEQATVTICHDKTKDLASYVRTADLLIVSIGNPNVIQAEWIKPNAIVVDVGIHRLTDGRIIGDVPFELAQHRAGWITPVPGGVGPMTVATLLQNTWLAHLKAFA